MGFYTCGSLPRKSSFSTFLWEPIPTEASSSSRYQCRQCSHWSRASTDLPSTDLWNLICGSSYGAWLTASFHLSWFLFYFGFVALVVSFLSNVFAVVLMEMCYSFISSLSPFLSTALFRFSSAFFFLALLQALHLLHSLSVIGPLWLGFWFILFLLLVYRFFI